MDKKTKTKSKAKPKRLKPNKESSTCLDVDLWEQNEDRFTAVELPGGKKCLPNTNSSSDSLCAATSSAPTAVAAVPTPSASPTTPSPMPKATIGGGDSGAALILLDPSQGDAAQPERGNWTGRFDFLLSLLGYSVGLGNVWRFPYLCYNNGGGAFLIPFTIMLIIAGLPLMFMELSFGQYAALGPVAIYRRFCPLFRGLGTGMVIVSAIVMLYYNLIIAWTIFYMFASFRYQLPWQNCEPEWSTENCFSYEMADNCDAINGTYYLRTCYNTSYADDHNITEMALHALKRPPAEEYFTNYVLGLSAGIEETGNIKLSLAACLFIAWAIVFLCLCKGVQSSGKVVYFTALFPYVVLVILFFRGVTLPGANTGILFYLTPDWKQLANAQVWGDAAVQIFFALSPAWGGLITLSSYNKFSNNCYKDSLIVAICNIATSFFAGLVIFSIIGFLAHELDVEVKKVVDQGAGLAFIVYPEVVTRLPVSPVWSVLFFVMLLTLGLDSQFALMETVTTAILDKFPNLRQYKTWVVLFVGIFGYIGGLGFTTNSGMYWLQLMDKYAANWSVLLIAISECVLIAWIYGSQRFLNDIQGMIGKRSRFWNIFWSTMWRYITPATLLFILFFNWVEYKPASYGHYVYPLWADAVGWIVGLLPVLVIFVIGFQQICKAPKHLSFKERLRLLLRPTAEWGPAGRPCVNLHAERYQSQTFDGVTNTEILINGIPTEISPYDDNGNGYRDEVMQLCERATAATKAGSAAAEGAVNKVDTISEAKASDANSYRNGNKSDSTAIVLGEKPSAPTTILPGPSILKSSKMNQSGNGKNKTHALPEVSPSKQPLIQSELRANNSVASFLNEAAYLQQKRSETATNVLTPKVLATTQITPVSAKTTTFAATTTIVAPVKTETPSAPVAATPALPTAAAKSFPLITSTTAVNQPMEKIVAPTTKTSAVVTTASVTTAASEKTTTAAITISATASNVIMKPATVPSPKIFTAAGKMSTFTTQAVAAQPATCIAVATGITSDPLKYMPTYVASKTTTFTTANVATTTAAPVTVGGKFTSTTPTISTVGAPKVDTSLIKTAAITPATKQVLVAGTLSSGRERVLTTFGERTTTTTTTATTSTAAIAQVTAKQEIKLAATTATKSVAPAGSAKTPATTTTTSSKPTIKTTTSASVDTPIKQATTPATKPAKKLATTPTTKQPTAATPVSQTGAVTITSNVANPKKIAATKVVATTTHVATAAIQKSTTVSTPLKTVVAAATTATLTAAGKKPATTTTKSAPTSKKK